MQKNTIDIINLGCSKNLVDSEILSRQLEAQGYKVVHDPQDPKGSIVIINTCGFIGDAKEESINTILQFGELRRKHKIERLLVMGCLSGRYIKELPTEIQEVDRYYGKFNWKEILTDLGQSYDPKLSLERTLTTPSHYAYLKISEGCNRFCSYCAIPIITGRHQSRPIEDLEAEVKWLVSQGVKEFQVIAQDLSYYGMDLYHSLKLAELVERLSDIKGVEWLRLHYAYPAQFPFDVLRVMRERDNVCKYIDIAFQHISDNVLEKMHRHVTSKETYELIGRIREEVPGVHVRTTLLTGHPGETEDDFNQLMEFVQKARFERMGAFPYSEEEGTYSAEHYKDDIPFEVKQERVDRIMEAQEEISREINQQKVGKVMKVIIDREESDFFVGRTQFDSPEVDPEVLISKNKDLKIGEFYPILITGAEDYDLYGELKD
ncbi:MAG TPA: 30S ribosomal protein S12 methylthiotransferase RimO [Paludibacteraceae bacterium]|nr:30S ribosomal protein S12 methylthiotransferase RimO [Paludibacteraceae bacterium]HOU69484.1 30S ribosomal protein S12 methylthiotransferase RimO [Paludibacteraceae bacterium]HQF51097.1 30S ribosomal protein S12 methylthiotransferase RimO [Paludibacteraceae bacterium]